jgi:hypothetical protein
MADVLIKKASGHTEVFDKEKLVASLRRAGATGGTIDKILARVEDDLDENITSFNIYKHAYLLLRKLEKPAAARYSLRRALGDLGPSGFPFESYISEIFRMRGFETSIRQILKGSCTQHEVDVVAWNENKLLMIESKFHNQYGVKTDLKVALYVKARFDDLSEQTFEYGGKRRALDEGWLITNTKFSQNVIQYAGCAGIRLLGWNYPEKGNLQDFVADFGLHPITCLETLTVADRQQLLAKDIVLCRDVVTRSHELHELGFDNAKLKRLGDEARMVCQPFAG